MTLRRNTHLKRNMLNRLLPHASILILKENLLQFSGFILLCLTSGLGVAIWKFSPEDPSINTSFIGSSDTNSLFAMGLTQNYLQIPGAIISDVLLQMVGYGIIIFLFTLTIWSFLLLSRRPLRLFMRRFLCLIISILFACQILSYLQNKGNYLITATYGGAVGELLGQQSQVFLKQWINDPNNILILTIFSIFFVLSFSYALGLKNHQWVRIIKNILGSGQIIARGLTLVLKWILNPSLSLFGKMGRWTRRDNFQLIKQEDYSISSSRSIKSIFEKNGTPSKNSSLQGELELGLEPIDFLQDENIIPNENRADGDINIHSFLQKVSGDEFSIPLSEDHLSKMNRDKQPSESSKKKSSGGLFSNFISSKSAPLTPEEYQLPDVELLDPLVQRNKKGLSTEQLESSAHHLEQVLQEFGVRGEIVGICPGPVVTMYEFKPAAGIKTSRVIGLADDIARSMSAHAARIAVISGRNVIGIELPNPTRDTVFLRELLVTEDYIHHPAPLAMILGKDIGGNPIIADLAKMPHLLVAGTTGSGKSVSINTMILSILFRQPPDKCKFIMVDPKMLEFSAYDGIPHLLTPVVTDPKKAVVALKWAVREMENRYRAMSKLGVRNIDGYNTRLAEARNTGELLIRRVQTGFDPDTGKPIFENQSLETAPLPYIVIVVDEMADLMLVAGKEIEITVQRLAQMARAAGIHLIMATQRPSVDVITGTIKANFPTRISFMVTSKIDSRTILGEQGAEQLLGQGDMLYMVGGGRLMRVHGPFVKDIEVERIVQFLKSQGEPNYIDNITEDDSEPLSGAVDAPAGDALYTQAVEIVRREGKASTSFVQRHLQIGYNRAARMIEQMEKEGIVSPSNNVGKREVTG